MAIFCFVIMVTPYKAIALQLPKPLVAIHVSELTQALETKPAIPPTPTGPGYSGFQWFYTSWHYFVAYESLKEALRSDGTPFVEISDSDIANGKLLNSDGSPQYPIMVSLASEAIANNEIVPLRDYVSAGGFLFVGSSSFTRYPDGTRRSDFALAGEMGLYLANSTLNESNGWNWYRNNHFTKVLTHRLTSHIPNGTLSWSSPLTSEEIPWGVSPNYSIHDYHPAWQVVASGATVIASGDAAPLLTVNNYGQGQIIFHGALQPLIGHGIVDPSMYSYQIYRKAIEWAFESFSLPIIKVSPWRYQNDATLLVRHDFENSIDLIKSIESSAQFEHSLGITGDYYYSTGALRTYMGDDKTAIISGLRNAVSSYGATIGSHNGGLKNPVDPLLQQTSFSYWHWGPDEALDQSPSGYSSGKAYAAASILTSFMDIEGWLSGLDNGRAGCGRTGKCPRNWASPYFNSTREASNEVLEQLVSTTMGERKVGPFPHFTISYNIPGKRFSHVSMPTSDWYVGTTTPRALDMGHTYDSMRAAVDFYYDSGMLINFYGHAPSNNNGLAEQYVTYSVSKPRLWLANATKVLDWWLSRSTISISPYFTTSGNISIITASISGARDADSAIEIVFPRIIDQPIGSMSVLLDGVQADLSDYRKTSYGIKVRTGSSVSSVKVQYSLQTGNSPPVAVNDTYSAISNTTLNQAVPGVLGNDTDPEGAALTTQLVNGPTHGSLTLNTNGSFAYTPVANYVGGDSFTYVANDGTSKSNVATVAITVTQSGNTLFSDDFTRAPGSTNTLLPWVAPLGTWSVSGGTLQGSNLRQYAYAYVSATPQWTDYIVQGRVQIPAGSFGGGIGGRVDSTTGAHYGAWVYPAGSAGGSNVLKLWKFRSWSDIGIGVPMRQISLPAVGTGWHTLKMSFTGNRILVYYDGALSMDVTDNNYDSRAPYLSGGISADWYPGAVVYTINVDDISVVDSTPQAVPVPVSNSLSPAAAVAGGAAFTLTVTGSGFINGSTVQWNGSGRTTAYVSATQLTASITAADIATAGAASVSVFSPAPGGGTSNALIFAISDPDNHVPATVGLSPANATAGGGAFTLTVTGSGFINGSTVQWNGSGRTTTFISPTQLTAAITAADIATAGTASVTVFNPAPGGGSSNAQTFTISTPGNPVPATTGLSPASATAGGAPFTLTVNGSGFITGSVVQWNGAVRTTTYVSSTQLTASITATDIATAGTASVTVFNPAPGGGTSNAQTFTINNINTSFFSDNFTRPAGTTDPLSPWVSSLGTWTVAGGVMQGSGSISQYSYAHIPGSSQWTDYVVQGRIQLPAGSFGGGIGGRVDPATGAHYGAWVYPAGSPGGSNVLKLWKFRSWTDIGAGVPMQQISLPKVGTGWHTLQMNFIGSRILVYYDGTLRMDVTDTNYDSRAPYLSGGISADWWTGSLPYTITVDDISVVAQ